MEIIPAIIAENFAELKEKIKLVEPHVKTVQLDIMDGIFVSNETWPFAADAAQSKPSPQDLDNLETNLFLEAHLMVARPHTIMSEWLSSKVGRIIIHFEAVAGTPKETTPINAQIDGTFPFPNLAREVHKKNKEFGIALNPETPLEVLGAFIGEIDLVLVMLVNPGFAGQPFQESVIPKITALRQKYPDVKIGVDGGVNSSNIKKLVGAGADFLVVGSYIFAAKQPAEVIKKLKEAIKIHV